MKQPLLVLLAILVVLTGAIGYYGIHLPKQNEVRVIQNQIAEERANQGVKGEVAALLSQIDRYRHRLPPDADPSWLAQEVMSVAQKSGVQLTSITQGAPQDFDRYTQLSVNLELSATYHQLGSFLDEIERSPRFIRIDRVTVERDEGGDQGRIHVTFSTLVAPPVIANGAG